MDEEIETTLKSLRSRHLNGVFAKDSEYAKSLLLDLIPQQAAVGIGDSTTVAQIGVKEELKNRGTKVLNGFDRKTAHMRTEDYEKFHNRLVKEYRMCDVFLTDTKLSLVTVDP